MWQVKPWSSNFPTLSGAYDETYNGGDTADVFVSRLSDDLSTLTGSTFLGGAKSDYNSSLAVNNNNPASILIYVAEQLLSSDFPTVSGGYDVTYNGNLPTWNGFVLRLNSDLTQLTASTFLGDRDLSLGIDNTGSVYVAGDTFYYSSFPSISGGYDEIKNGNHDIFVSRLNSDLTNLEKSTFLGGSNAEFDPFLVIDNSGTIYVTGVTESFNFPSVSGAYDETWNGGRDIFVSRLNSDLSSLERSTFIGSSPGEYYFSLAVDHENRVFVSGTTWSQDFPVTSGGYDQAWNGTTDIFISLLSSDLKSLTESTFLGGSKFEDNPSLALGKSGSVYVVGTTTSSDFPTVAGGYDETHNGSQDVFVSLLSSDLSSVERIDLPGRIIERGQSLSGR